MNAMLILDNSPGVPANVAGIFGLDNFADLIVKKRSLRQRLVMLAGALSWGDVVVLDGGPIRSNVQHRIERLCKAGGCAVYVPSYVHLAASDDDARDFLEKVSYATQSLSIVDGVGHSDQGGRARPSLFVLQGADLLAFLNAPNAESRQAELAQLQGNVPSVPADFSLLDLRDTEEFLHAVTSTFDARHFNQVASTDRYTITKRSTNADKLKQEFEFFSWIPPRMRRFFIEPFNYTQDAQGASYQMERLLVPDFALQWLHNSVRLADFEQFIRHVFYFLNERDTRQCDQAQGKALADALYVDKLLERIELLHTQPGFQDIAMHANHAFGGVRQLVDRYLALYKRLSKQRTHDRIAIIHGDLCFSNVLYNGALGTLKLIDPRGARSVDALYADPYYDLAKLSHSIEGLYDYINAGQFQVVLDGKGKPALHINTPPRAAEVGIFRKHCQAAGASSRLIRLYEASLFISMTPLHIESPLKVLGFLLNADNILRSVENDAAWTST